MTPPTPVIAALRRLTAHLDPSDPNRKPGRTKGTTSPYMGDFEIDEGWLAEDVQLVTNALKGMVGE